MPKDVLPPGSTPLGAWVRERLREERIAWLTAVDPRRVAQPNPVWFLWEDDSILIYNGPTARRLEHIRARPRVTLNLETHGRGGEAIVLTGDAAISADTPPAHQHADFMAKYGEALSMPPQTWSDMFSVPLRIRLLRFRGFLLTG